jgi:hypothetical protein
MSHPKVLSAHSKRESILSLFFGIGVFSARMEAVLTNFQKAGNPQRGRRIYVSVIGTAFLTATSPQKRRYSKDVQRVHVYNGNF